MSTIGFLIMFLSAFCTSHEVYRDPITDDLHIVCDGNEVIVTPEDSVMVVEEVEEMR